MEVVWPPGESSSRCILLSMIRSWVYLGLWPALPHLHWCRLCLAEAYCNTWVLNALAVWLLRQPRSQPEIEYMHLRGMVMLVFLLTESIPGSVRPDWCDVGCHTRRGNASTPRLCKCCTPLQARNVMWHAVCPVIGFERGRRDAPRCLDALRGREYGGGHGSSTKPRNPVHQ